MTMYARDEREWLEADGLGGFASGTVSGIRTRRYHGLLLAATTPPTGRMMLLNGFDAWVETASGRFPISAQRYTPDVVHPDGAARIESFTADPWPTWTFRLDDDTTLTQEILVPHGQSAAIVMWRLAGASGARTAASNVRLIVRPFLSGRDYHSTHHENAAARQDARRVHGLVLWRLYDGIPTIVSRANARYEHQPDWYRNFLYTAERDRGLDDREDLLSPGWLTWDLGAGPAVWYVRANGDRPTMPDADAVELVAHLRATELARRRAFPSPLHRAADAYLVRRGAGKTIVAGYPWFTDWGRDTFIAIRGLCFATGRYAEGLDILLQWTAAVSEGMLPNRFPDAGDAPELNAVDASLWYILAVQAFLEAAAPARGGAACTADRRRALLDAVTRILEGYARGTRYGIRMDDDGLLACGVPGVQLTWMDAKVGDRVITPRIGKPVEVQALWLNALRFAGEHDARWVAIYERGRAAFETRFWNDAAGCLYDVIDVDHDRGRVDPACRPNQIFAAGGLPTMLLDPSRARQVVDSVERRLLAPLGLRSLAPGEADYTPHYGGSPAQRDAAYHQGIVWPWLLGAFVDAWLATREDDAPAARREARARFLEPLRAHLSDAGLGHVSEVADAEPPFTPGGCPFQAWSLGELLRIEARLADADTTHEGLPPALVRV